MNTDENRGSEVVASDDQNEAPSVWQRFVGDYDFRRLCKPRLNPWKKDNQEPLPYYGRDDRLAGLVAIFLGFQHSLAVVAGTVLPGILIGSQDPSGKAGPYLVSYALITSGICTWIQILHTPIPKTKYFVGSGMLCVIATSFAFLPTTQQTITKLMNEGKTFEEAYGSLLGVFMVGSIFQSCFAFIPGDKLRRIFPAWLAGLCVFLIGVNLVGVGIQQWGGGGNCLSDPGSSCNVGYSELPYGSTEFIGLGFLVMSTIIFIELFGSPFLRSCGIAVALLFGYLVASLSTDSNGDSYTDSTPIEEAPVALFLWTKTFPIGFYAPALVPVLIGYLVSTIETYGDTTATAEASGIEAESKEHDEAIQGGLLADSINSLFSALAMVLPSTTLSQNIGIISLTNVASRDAGYACGAWMLFYGIFGKVGAFFTSIPLPVLGGMSTFLFANIAISGIKVMTTHGIDRRSRFIMSVAGSFGLGTIIVPEWFTSGNFLDCPAIESEFQKGLCDAVILTLSTGYAVGAIVALVLNGILPAEDKDESGDYALTVKGDDDPTRTSHTTSSSIPSSKADESIKVIEDTVDPEA